MNDWSSYKELYTTHYVPLKTVSNINGSFSFYESMYMVSPYTSLSLGLDISNARNNRDIDLKIGVQVLPDDLRKEMTNVMIPDNLKVSYGGFKIVN